MAKHTPGPWTAKAVRSGGPTRHLVYFKLNAGKGQRAVAVAGTSVYCGKTDGSVRIISEEECEANARLIRAAPELLAACEALLDLVRQCNVQIHAEYGVPAVRAALAAIAKAKGENSK